VLVTQHRLGFISANAGIDQSNVDGSEEHVLLLPRDPDASADMLRRRLHETTGAELGVVISDSHGRPFRMGNIGVAIGAAGIPALLDLRGQPDLFGRELRISMQGYADLIASAAHLLSGEGDEGRPIMHMRGLQFTSAEGRAGDLIRSPEQDLYR
jgi:coenzyme F420-0:L-glutamate ligase/coenzyme F420-1:gamma-L-glutamate ligase